MAEFYTLLCTPSSYVQTVGENNDKKGKEDIKDGVNFISFVFRLARRNLSYTVRYLLNRFRMAIRGC